MILLKFVKNCNCFYGTVGRTTRSGYPSSYASKFFDTRSFLRHRSPPHPTKHFGTVRQSFWLKIVIPPPPSYPWRLFHTRSFPEQKSPPRIFSVVWDKKFPTENRNTIPLHKIFRYQKFSEIQKPPPPLRNFSVLWDKKLSTENRKNASYAWKRRYQKLSETQKDCATKLFGTMIQKMSRENRNFLSCPKIFRWQNFSETPKGSSGKFIGTVR